MATRMILEVSSSFSAADIGALRFSRFRLTEMMEVVETSMRRFKTATLSDPPPVGPGPNPGPDFPVPPLPSPPSPDVPMPKQGDHWPPPFDSPTPNPNIDDPPPDSFPPK